MIGRERFNVKRGGARTEDERRKIERGG